MTQEIINRLKEKVAIAATIFREYERLHMKKGTLDGDAKALRNGEYAEEMEAARVAEERFAEAGWNDFLKIAARNIAAAIRALALPTEPPSQGDVEGRARELPETLNGHWMTPKGREMALRYLPILRSDLVKRDMSDFELANRVYMAGREDLDLIVWQEAAKDRIRWLSIQLALASKEDGRS